MAHLPVSAIIFKRLIILLTIPIASLSTPAKSHEVIASTVTVSRDGHHVEILQTSPIGALQTLVTPHEEPRRESDLDYESLLRGLSAQWIASSGNKVCRLDRQAYRPLKSGHEIQFRFLFICKEDAENVLLSAKWVEMMPPSHFILLDMERDGRSFQAIIEERPAKILIPIE